MTLPAYIQQWLSGKTDHEYRCIMELYRSMARDLPLAEFLREFYEYENNLRK